MAVLVAVRAHAHAIVSALRAHGLEPLGVDLVPLWSLAVANVYRKSKRSVVVREHAGPVG